MAGKAIRNINGSIRSVPNRSSYTFAIDSRFEIDGKGTKLFFILFTKPSRIGFDFPGYQNGFS